MRFTGCALPSLPSSCGSSAATFPTTTVCACIQGSATLHPLPMKRERRDRTTCLRNRGKIHARPSGLSTLRKGEHQSAPKVRQRLLPGRTARQSAPPTPPGRDLRPPPLYFSRDAYDHASWHWSPRQSRKPREAAYTLHQLLALLKDLLPLCLVDRPWPLQQVSARDPSKSKRRSLVEGLLHLRVRDAEDFREMVLREAEQSVREKEDRLSR